MSRLRDMTKDEIYRNCHASNLHFMLHILDVGPLQDIYSKHR